MSRAPSIRTFAAHEWRTYRDLRLRALADSPDAFGRTLEEERTRPDAAWSERLAAGTTSGSDLPALAEAGGEAVGLAWGRIDPAGDPAVAHLYQMWVDPQSRGHGAGRLLLDAVISWAAATGARGLELGVTCGDTPATRLYARAGFVPIGKPEPVRPGSPLLGQAMRLALPGRAALGPLV